MGFLRRNPKLDDEDRTVRLLDAVDGAFDNPAGAAAFENPRSFESVVLHGVAYDPAKPHPPAGHTYPR
ncbi:hypothetical protein ABT010_13350 [Streptomyces sp. NPDC002668]|uniref:hypothetical protein n=1 Tax=Streptomyces sp. NPDC002668 TaxID=3154422 RepID=UPI00331C4A10